MTRTLFDLTLELARCLGTLSEGVATGGDSDTILDSVERTESDDYWNNGSVWITYDAAGAGAAPQGEYGYISDFANTGGNISIRTALTAAVAANDRYAIATPRYPLHLLIQKVNETFGVIEKTDVSTVTIASNQLEYSLPSGLLELKEVWIATDSDVNGWEKIYDWYTQKSDTGTADKLVFARQHVDGYAVKLVYTTYHQVLRVATDKLDDSIHEKKVVYNAAVGCLLWRKAKVGDSDSSVNELLNYYQAKAEQINQEFRQVLPKRSAKTIHPVFDRP